MSALVLRDVEVGGRRVSVSTGAGVVRAVGPDPDAPAGTTVVDGGGAALLPGLHDHHLHLMAMAAALDSVPVGPDRLRGADALGAALRSFPEGPGGWVRAVGYHEEVAGDLDRRRLDALVADRPVRVQHRSGGLWVLNSAALREVGLLDGPLPGGVELGRDGTTTGRLFGLDGWLRGRLPRRPLDLGRVGRMLLHRGVTGVTDATPVGSWEDLGPLVSAVEDGTFVPAVTVTGSPALDPGQAPPGLEPGPAKLLLQDHDLPAPEVVADLIATARARHRAVAVHCVTRAALVTVLAALELEPAGPGDRVEHGAVVPPELAGRLAALGVTVVTQPGFVAERGDQYLREVDAEDLPHLWPCRSLLEAGVRVAAGSDAPFGAADPWAAVAAAAHRRTPAGEVVGAEERIDTTAALGLFLGSPKDPGGPARRVRPGARTDLCLLDRPLADALAAPREVAVRAVTVDGTLHELTA